VITPDVIRDAVRAHANEILAWTMALMRFPSENRPPHGAEGPAQTFIANACREARWEVDCFRPDAVDGIARHPSWLPGRAYDWRENVVARWKGAGRGKSLLLSGHVDVAPFEPDNWTVCRPYDPVIRDGRLYGRGGADMKAGLAAAFWAMRILRELQFQPAGDVLFESLVDEEFAGGNGTLAARLRGYHADLAIVGEPTRMRVCSASFGAFLGNLTITGNTAGMPFMGQAIPNPLHGAARAVELFQDWQAQWRAENHHPLFTEPGAELNTLLWQIDSTKPGEFSQMGTPLLARLAWIVWCHPGMTEDAFYRRFRAFWAEAAAQDPALAAFTLQIAPDYHCVKPWETPVSDPAVQALIDAYRGYAPTEPVIAGATFSCDLAIYGEAGIPVVLLGPRGGNLHAPDEWVEAEDLLTLTGIYAHAIASWCGS